LYLCCFFLLFLLSGSKAKSKVSSVGIWWPFVSPNGGFWPASSTVFSIFWSQIYSTPLFFSRHAPLSLILRHRPLPLPEARVTSIVGDRLVACTRQRGLCSLARVKATLHLFWPCSLGTGATVADLRLGAAGDGACLPRAAISGGIRPCLLCRLLCFLVFSVCVVVNSLVSLYSLAVYFSDFIGIFVG
jgi:hypothetical protein